MDGKTQGSFAEGWNIFYQARTVFGVLLIIAMLVNLGVFFAARFGGMTEPKVLPVGPRPAICATMPPCVTHGPMGGPGMLPPAKAPMPPMSPAGPRPATASAPAAGAEMPKPPMMAGPAPKMPCGMPRETVCVPVEPKELGGAMRWFSIFENVMNMTSLVTLVSVVFLVFCALLGVMMLLAGQLPGAGALAGAFFWAIGIVAFVLPWDVVLPQVMCLPIGLANFTDIQMSLREVLSMGDDVSKWCFIGEVFQQWVKFVVIPVLVILIDIMYLKRTSDANKMLAARPV